MHAAIANSLWLASAAPAALRFRRALSDPQAVQERILRRYLNANADTSFGRRHNFARLRTIDDYQHAVPLSSYGDYAPYVDAIAAGEQCVLTRQSVRCFVPSGGSTGGEKLIPYTADLQREFSRAISPWIFDLYRRHPSLIGGKAYWSISPVARPRRERPLRIPVGFDEDSAYVGGFAKRLVDSTLAVPGDVKNIEETETFRYVSLLHLLRCRELALVSVWHPSFLLLLLEPLPVLWDRLLHDIRRGGASVGYTDRCDRLRPDAARARELRSLDPRCYQQIWPKLKVISCWTDAHAASELPPLRSAFPGVAIQGKGLIATEAFVSLPVGEQKPLAVLSHFFEFAADDDRTLLAHELEVGEAYSLVVTTGGGLYRYRLHDRVRVTGFVGCTPCLEFLGKEDHVSDLFGEKLSEAFVQRVLERVLDQHRIPARFSMLAPNGDHYVLFLQSDEPIPGRVAQTLDEQLCAGFHYRYCRDLGQLKPARVFRVRGDGHAQFIAAAHRRARRMGSVKPTCLCTWSSPADFEGDFLSPPPAPSAFTGSEPSPAIPSEPYDFHDARSRL